MILFKKANDIRKWLELVKRDSSMVGFVPTMGALHEGHLSLIDASLKENALTVCSIFVNPTQFNDPGDFEKYPVTIEKDIYQLQSAGCDAIFLPPVSEIYPGGIETAGGKKYDLGYLESILEGKYRPGHFQGVCQVVHRLLDIIKPGRLYLGQKDYQQCMVISRLTGLIGSNTEIRICPTLREPDGLAMSSRNLRLDVEQRRRATMIYQTLSRLKNEIRPGPTGLFIKEGSQNLQNAGFKVDYTEIANAKTLHPVVNWDGKEKIVALIAALLGEIRLIDNMQLN
jgi:pantoate--beta-alanine ligase